MIVMLSGHLVTRLLSLLEIESSVSHCHSKFPEQCFPKAPYHTALRRFPPIPDQIADDTPEIFVARIG